MKIKRQWKSTLREGRTGTRQTKSSHHLYFLCLSSPSACLELFTIYMDKPFGWRFGHANGKQNSVVVNFVPESRLLICVQISFIYRETAARTLNWYQRWLWRNKTRPGKQKNVFQPFRCSSKFSTEFLEQSSGDLSNCIFVNGKQPCSPSWRFRTMPMTSCNGSIFHLPRLLDFLHCCSLQMWAQRWIYRARRIQWSTEVSSKNLPECKKLPFHDRTGTKNVSHEVKLGQRSLMKGLPQTLVQNFQFEYLEGPQLPFR